MKQILVAAIAVTAALAFKNKPLSTPEDTVKTFLTLLQQGKYQEAKEHATPNSAKTIDLIATIDKTGAGTKDHAAKLAFFKAASFTIGQTVIKGNKATTTVIFTSTSKNDTTTIATSETSKNEWKANFSK